MTGQPRSILFSLGYSGEADVQDVVTKRLSWMSATSGESTSGGLDGVAAAAAEGAQHNVWTVVEAAVLRCLK